ncbi:hypothetical protein LUZ63_004924 [Rhynchospora breviuscula]|uniref:C3H1-type domain-containing protein n=1 Tax=Rhynchospora breviuscula TaxID=2022672 RepID=A0A9Q0CMK1_9POAL|nr:hypothetical protein LUZ63_004924 [Rhynchospora breviuscula]
MESNQPQPQPQPQPETNPNPREALTLALVHKRPGSQPPSPEPEAEGSKRLRRVPTVPVCPDFLRRQCRLSPFHCTFAHPPPSVDVEHDKVIVCCAFLWNVCLLEGTCRYLHPLPHIHEALLREMHMDYKRPGHIHGGYLQGNCIRSEHHSVASNNANMDKEVFRKEDQEESISTFDTFELNIDKARDVLSEGILCDLTSIESMPMFIQCVVSIAAGHPMPIPSYNEIVRDLKRFYGVAKSELKRTLRFQRVCLSTETWKDERKILHMAVRAHWIDNEWNLCNKMLSFCSARAPFEGREVFCKKIEKSLFDWGITKILTLTVDEISSNDPLVQYLKFKTKDANDAVLGHKFMKLKSFSHVVGEVAKEVLEYHRESVSRVRFAVLNVIRTLKVDLFAKCAEKEGIKFEWPLFLNDETVWDSTYMLLEKAVGLQKAFERFMEEDSVYLSCFYMPEGKDQFDEEEKAPGPPSETDWENARCLVTVLRLFYKVMCRLSDPSVVMVNTFSYELLGVQVRLAQLSKSEDQVMTSLAKWMKKKIDQQWGDINDLNPLVLVAMVLDPRYKLKGVKFCFDQVVNDKLKVERFAEKVEITLFHLYEHYIGCNSNLTNDIVAFSANVTTNLVDSGADEEDHTKCIRDQYVKLVVEEGKKERNQEVSRYLSESCEIDSSTFDLLGWWRHNSFWYPTLSQIARDVLAIPVCAAFYEDAFRTEFRELDLYRLSKPRDLREILVVGKDWFKEKPPADYKESWIDGFVKSDEEDEDEEDEVEDGDEEDEVGEDEEDADEEDEVDKDEEKA